MKAGATKAPLAAKKATEILGHHTGKFPRNHRFVLGERIERKLYDLLETLIRAKYTKAHKGGTVHCPLSILTKQSALAQGLFPRTA